MPLLTKYEGAGEIYLNGRLLAEAKSVRVRIRSNDNPVNTMQKGMGGFSDGAEIMEADIESAVPKAGYEVDFYDICRLKREVRLVVIDAGKRRQGVGRITEFESAKQTDADAGASASFMGKPIN